MAICHTVRKGDSLWSLACRYLGNGTKWPAILKRHNREAAMRGRDKRLLPIKDRNLIYVGQYIMIPGNRRNVPAANGSRHEASQNALPVNLKVTYTIGRDTLPVVYVKKGADFTVTSKMSGQIGVELLSADRHRHSLELAMSRDSAEARMKLQQAYDPALKALIVEPDINFDPVTNKVMIKAPIAAKAGLGTYTVEINVETPLHLSGKLKPATAEGTVEVDGRRYKYSADLELKVDVVLEPKPRGRGDEMVKVTKSQEQPLFVASEKEIDWQKIRKESKEVTAIVAWTIVGIALMWYTRTINMSSQTTSMQPFMHTINPNDPRCLKNPGMI